jgi:hypothetical protein
MEGTIERRQTFLIAFVTWKEAVRGRFNSIYWSGACSIIFHDSLRFEVLRHRQMMLDHRLRLLDEGA